MWAICSKSRLDMEQNAPRSIWDSKNNSQKDVCMQYYVAARPLHLETNTSIVSLEFRLLQLVRDAMNCRHNETPDNAILWPTAFASKNLSTVEWSYSSIECKALGRNWAREIPPLLLYEGICIISDHKLLGAMSNRDVAILLQWLQCIMLWIHQCRMCIIYRPGPDLYIMDWISCNNYAENRDQEIAGMRANVNAILTSVNIQVCISIQDIQTATHEDAHIQEVKGYWIQGLPHSKER